MSNWVVNANATIPFSGSLGSSTYPYVYYDDQATATKHGQAVAPEAREGLSSAPNVAGPQPAAASAWSHSAAATQMRSWASPPHPGGQPMIYGLGDQPVATSPANQSLYEERIFDLERELQAARAQCEKQQQQGRILHGQMESLTSDLAAERHRAEDLTRQLVTVSAAHQALQLEHERLISQHAAIVREHEHTTSSQAAALRELEARHAEVTRLQRQLDEAQAAAKASAAAAAVAAGQQPGTTAAGKPGASRAMPPPHTRITGHAGVHLSAAEEDKWGLRLHKAERALEEERRVSEDLRHQLKAAEADSRAMYQRLRQLEAELESPSGARASAAANEAALKSPRGLSPLSPPPPLFSTSSGALPPSGSGPLLAVASGSPSGAGAAALGRAASAGSGMGSSQAQPGGAKVGLSSGSAFASSATGFRSGGAASGGGASQLPAPQEEHVARLKREVDGLRSDLTKLAAAEELHRVAARAAEDRARAAELVSLDVQKQCDQAARTIGRLIDENSELVAKLNSQANVLADCKTTAASKEAMLRSLETRLAQAEAQLAAVQAQGSHAAHQPAGDMQGQQPVQDHLSNGLAPADGPRGHREEPAMNGNEAGRLLPQTGGVSHPAGAAPGAGPGREVLLPGGPLTEADWKLVMLSEEIRRLIKEVSLSSTACLALQLKSLAAPLHHLEAAAESAGSGNDSSEEPKGPPLDLERILSRLEGLAGRRLGPGETAAYIIELAGHMEALDHELNVQKRRMAALRGTTPCAGPEAGPVVDGVGLATGADANVNISSGVGQGHGPAQAVSPQLDQVQLKEEQQQQAVGQVGSMQGVSGTREEGQAVPQALATPPGPASPSGHPAVDGGIAVQDTLATAVSGTLEEVGSARALARNGAFGSFVDGSSSRPTRSSTASQQQPSQSQPSAHPASPTPAPPPAAHHIVSPFNHLAHRRDPQSQPAGPPLSSDVHQGVDGTQPQQSMAGASTGVDDSNAGAESSGPRSSLDFRNTQRSELAAAAAAAVAAAAAAEADRAGPATAPVNAGAVAVVLQPVEAPPSPRAAPGTAAVLAPVPIAGLATDAGVSGADALLEDDLLDEAAAGRVKPRRARVGLWGWISGDSSR